MYTANASQISSSALAAVNAAQLAASASPLIYGCNDDSYECMSPVGSNVVSIDLSGAMPISGNGNLPYRDGVGRGSTVHAFGIERGSPAAVLMSVVRKAMHNSMDLSRIKPGDKVLVVPAINSGDPHPATVHPLALSTMVEELRIMGADVTVGCMSGIEYVLQTPSGIKKGTSRGCAEKAGVLEFGNIQFKGFEEDGWSEGFRLYEDPMASHWPHGFHITKMIDEADHVVLASRISTHAMAGVTLGIKNLVGLLREDSRLDFHQPGPMNWFMRLMACGSGLKGKKSPKPDFFERIAEMGLPIQDKLLGSLLVATKLQTTMGPNAHIMEIGGLGFIKSYIDYPETGIVISSNDMVGADAVAYAFLVDRYRHTPWWPRMMQKLMIMMNGQIGELGTYDIYDDRVMKHALNIGLGQKVAKLETPGMSPALRKRLDAELGIG